MRLQRIHRILYALLLTALARPTLAADRGPLAVATVGEACYAIATSAAGPVLETIDIRTGAVLAEAALPLTDGEQVVSLALEGGTLRALLAHGGRLAAVTIDPANGAILARDDASSPTCSDKPVVLIKGLLARVRGWVARGILTVPQGDLLIAPLEQARLDIRMCQIAAAISQVQSFERLVEKYHAYFILTRDQANELLQPAGEAVVILGSCTCLSARGEEGSFDLGATSSAELATGRARGAGGTSDLVDPCISKPIALIDSVRPFINRLPLTDAEKETLLLPLKFARQKVRDGNYPAAVSYLMSYLAVVDAFAASGAISPTQAAQISDPVDQAIVILQYCISL